MNKKKVLISILVIMIIISLPFAIKAYKENKSDTQLKQLEEQRKEEFNNSLRFNLKLDDKKYYYKSLNKDISSDINGKDQNLKYSSYGISDNSEYVLTKINEEEVRLYCDIPIDKAIKDYIKTFGSNCDIYVATFNNSKIVLLSIYNDKSHNYILDLDNRSTNWIMSDKFDGAYYRSSTDTVICTRNIHPTDDILGKMEYQNFEINMYGETHEIQ